VKHIATALIECPTTKPLAPRDRLFAIAHEDKDRKTVLANMKHVVHSFFVVNALILPLCMAALGVGIAERERSTPVAPPSS
jgi:hypothetical protein